MPGREIGNSVCVSDITAHQTDSRTFHVRVPGRVPDDCRDVVPPAESLTNSRPSDSPACPENNELAHGSPRSRLKKICPLTCPSKVATLMVTSWIPHYGGAVTKPLDPEMFDPLCPSDLMPFRVGDKWAGMIIQCLEDGPRRFSELRVPLRNITSKVLTQSLRTLERDGFIVRTVHAGPVRHVEYELTSLGRSLLDLLDAARTWAEAHLDELIDAHEAHHPPTEPANTTPCPRPDTSP